MRKVLISALLFGGLPGSFLDLALLGAFLVAISPPLLEELDEKLRLKFGLSPVDAAAIQSKLLSVAGLVVPDFNLDVIDADPDDNRVLECAVKANADCIITGDRHLKNLREYAGMPILTVRQFLDRIAVS